MPVPGGIIGVACISFKNTLRARGHLVSAGTCTSRSTMPSSLASTRACTRTSSITPRQDHCGRLSGAPLPSAAQWTRSASQPCEIAETTAGSAAPRGEQPARSAVATPMLASHRARGTITMTATN